MKEIITYVESELTPEVASAIATISCLSFGSSGDPHEKRVELMLAASNKSDLQSTSGRRFVIWENDNVIAHARTFVRNIIVGEIETPVLALASVCSTPEKRGQGLGVAITKKAFGQVGRTGWPEVSLFQTPVAKFYEKLNCRIVSNRFVDRTNKTFPDANPWRDDTIMIYPCDSSWSEETVDLNGPDY